MSDKFSKAKRSEIMSAVKHENTAPEIIVRKYLFSKGFRYRKNDKRYPGHPDIVLPRYKTVVFVHGCFWHNHIGCKAARTPKSNVEFWTEKQQRNAGRDALERKQLEELGWHIIVVWECEITSKAKKEERLELLARQIKGLS
ncbi:MAG: DNA mismatch endonuclease Vsr [Smithella sp.]